MWAHFSSLADLLDNGSMTNYPGEPASPAAQPDQASNSREEPTEEVGYWASKSAAEEQGAEPTVSYPQTAPVWNPTTQHPYGTMPPAAPAPMPTPPPPNYPNVPSGYANVPPGYSPVQVPVLPQANTALILGIISLAGAFVCVLPLFASPAAWLVGNNALKAVRASNGQYRGETEARIGQVLGIIGTVLLGLAIIGLVLFFVLIAGIAGQSAYSGVVST